MDNKIYACIYLFLQQIFWHLYVCHRSHASCRSWSLSFGNWSNFQYQLRSTIELLDLKYGSGPIKILEKRLSQIPRYPNFKIFKNGFERLNRLTTSEYRYLMKIMLLVLDELILDKKLNKNLCNLYFLWIDMYMEPLTQIYWIWSSWIWGKSS